MAVYKEEKFDKATIFLDGNSYYGCEFLNCTIVYAGGPVPMTFKCKFRHSEFVFEGPARNTVELLGSWLSSGSGLAALAAGALGIQQRTPESADDQQPGQPEPES